MKPLAALDLADIPSASILNSLPDGVYITDTDRRIVFWNREAERMTGYAAKDVIGHRCHENILCHVDKDGHLLCGHEHCPLHRAMSTGTQSDFPHLIFAKHRSGTRIPVEVSVSPIFNEGGTVIGGIEVFRDLSPAFRDLNRARVIQQESVRMHLEPDPRLRVSVRYTPHDQVGGDFYRIERMPDDTYAILLADAIGHGVSAALSTMELRALWEDGRAHQEHPEQFLAWLNQRVEPLTDTDSGYFATAVYARYNADSGQLRCASAGHPPVLLIRQNGIAEWLHAAGPGLGMIPDPCFTTAETTLEQGDHAILFTDGATEVMNGAREELGEDAFIAMILEAHRCGTLGDLAVIEENLLRFSESLSLPDDLTMIHLERL